MMHRDALGIPRVILTIVESARYDTGSRELAEVDSNDTNAAKELRTLIGTERIVEYSTFLLIYRTL